MRNWMAAASATLIAVGSARAAERTGVAAAPVDVKVADDARSGAGLFSGAGYGTSDRFGRAWLVLHYQVEAACLAAEGTCEQDAPVAVAVPGLAYDAAARRVTYERPGADPVVCATTRHHAFGEALDPTGACVVRLEKVDRVVDDGFDGRRDRRDEVHFVVASPGAPETAGR